MSSSSSRKERKITSIFSVPSYSPLASTSLQRGSKETLDCDSTILKSRYYFTKGPTWNLDKSLIPLSRSSCEDYKYHKIS